MSMLFNLDKGVLIKIIEKIEERHTEEMEILKKKCDFILEGLGGEKPSYFCDFVEKDVLTKKEIKCYSIYFYNSRLEKYTPFECSSMYYCYACYKNYCSKHVFAQDLSPCCSAYLIQEKPE